jgi:DNA-binding GntR family transcriptional regulator
MDAVEAAIARAEIPIGIQTIAEIAGCGKIRTVRSAISQLVEEGRVARGGLRYAPTYTIAKEMAA